MQNKFVSKSGTFDQDYIRDGALMVRYAVFVDEQNFVEENELDHLDFDLPKNAPVGKNCDFSVGNAGYDTVHFVVFVNMGDNDLQDLHAVATVRLFNAQAQQQSLKQIGRLAVLKQYRSHGIGRQLMQAIESYVASADNHNVKTLRLNAQSYVLKFYKSLGYAIDPENPDEFDKEGTLHYTMIKHIQ